MPSRRFILASIGTSLLVAPSIVRAASLMPIRGTVMDTSLMLDPLNNCILPWITLPSEPFWEELITSEPHLLSNTVWRPGMNLKAAVDDKESSF